MTLSGIEPATFWLVAQCLKKLRYRVPPMFHVVNIYIATAHLEDGDSIHIRKLV